MPLTPDDKEWISEQLRGMATKADLEQLATKADLETIETKLLTAFHAWASPLEARFSAFKSALAATDAEYEHIKQRLKRIEDRLGIKELSS